MIQEQKKRHVVSYENMSPELAEVFAEKYPKGLQDCLADVVKYTKPDGTPFYAVTIELPDSVYLKEARDIAYYHHEKWNGKGYPTGISGTDIPLSARVMAVADVFDALVSERVYKPAYPIEKAIDIIKNDAGTHFDPEVVEAFLQAEEQIRKVEEEFRTKKG